MEILSIFILMFLGILMFLIGSLSTQKKIRYCFIIFGIITIVFSVCFLKTIKPKIKTSPKHLVNFLRIK